MTPLGQLVVGTFTNASGEAVPAAFGTRAPAALSRGIYTVPFDAVSGEVGAPRLAAEVSNPANLIVHPARHTVYACRSQDARIGDESPVTAFAALPDGRLVERGTVGSGGLGPTVGMVDPSGANLLVSNWITSSVVCLRLAADGSLLHRSSLVGRADPTAPLPPGVGGPPGSPVPPGTVAAGHTRPHDVAVSPCGRYAVVAETSANRVAVLRLDAARGTLALHRTAPAPPGSGPRHLCFPPRGRHLYTSDEEGAGLSMWEWAAGTGTLRHRQQITTVPDGVLGHREHPADVRVHPGGRFVYVTNRAVGTIAGFAIDPETGDVTQVGHTSVGSASCWSLAFDHSGRWAFATAILADRVLIFAVDPATGRLLPHATVPVTLPTCVRWI